MSLSLQESMSTMKEMFLKRTAAFEAELPKSQGTPSLTTLAFEYNTFKTFVVAALNGFQQQIDILAHTVDSMEMRSRRKMLLLHGVKEIAHEDTAKIVVDVVNKHLITADLTTANIRRCHRMGRQSADHKPRPIVIKFESTAIRDGLWYAKTKFKGSGLTVSEFLTKQRHEAFMAARQRFGVSQCWTKDGYIYVLASDGTRHRVVNVKEVNNMESKDADKPPSVGKLPTKTKRSAAQKK